MGGGVSVGSGIYGVRGQAVSSPVNVVKFKYIYVYIWNKIDILVSSKKKKKKKWCDILRGASKLMYSV